MDEIWKVIPKYNGNYEASDLGRIRSLFSRNRSEGGLMQQLLNTKGYPRVQLVDNGKKVSALVHRLVMSAFHGESNLHVDHINENKTDNRLCNLRYCTNRENHKFYRIKRKKSSKYVGVHLDKRTGKWVAMIRIDGPKKNLGLFRCETAAHIVYEKKLKEISLNT